MSGFITLHRSILDWEWWDDHNVTRLFLYMLLEANFQDNMWKGVLIKRGQMATSLNNLALGSGMTVKQVRTALDKMERCGTIEHKGQTKYSIITITNYENYQSEGKQKAHKWQTKGTQRATIKQGNKETSENNIPKGIFKKPTHEEIKNYCAERNNGIDENRFYDFYESKGWVVGKTKMKDWKAAVRNWERSSNKKQNKPEASEVDLWLT